MARTWHVALLVVISLCTVHREASGQYFGRNKVEYKDFDFKVLKTEHFDIYCYPTEETAAGLVGRLAERWYSRLSTVLGHQLKTRQPLVLYGNHPDFAQTNIVAGWLDEGIGGVTESSRRRIVMPFAPTLHETDRVLGHELVHAFQFDILGRFGSRAWPRWATEGLAQYLSLGATDAPTVMWLRDAAVHDLLPARRADAERKFSPYRYGYAMWAYLAGRYGDEVIGTIMKAGRKNNFSRRIQQATGVELEQLYSDWRSAALEQFRAQPVETTWNTGNPLLRGPRSSRIHLGPALSPDGRSAVFFSEQDRLSIDLFLADAEMGTVSRKLATLAANAKFESLQAIRSAGSWSDQGDRVAFAAIEQGRSTLAIFDVKHENHDRTIKLPQLGQILSLSWSPHGDTLALSVLDGGVTDLYLYDLGGGTLRRLTNDPFADLQPAWSPDGRHIAFATDRFSSELTTLRFGPCALAILDVETGELSALPAIEASKHLNPQWSNDGDSLYFIGDPGGLSNVYRLDVQNRSMTQVTNVSNGVTGMIDTSPALSVARRAPRLAFSIYQAGKYQIQLLDEPSALAGVPFIGAPTLLTTSLPPASRADDQLATLLRDARSGLPEATSSQSRAYAPDLSLDSIGQPYLSSGGGPFGGFMRAGGSLLFSDLLGERMLATTFQVGGRMRDVDIGIHFLNRERRWNWGALAELEPTIRRLPRRQLTEAEGQSAMLQQTEYFERIQLRLAGVLAYPLSHARRIELTAGVRHARYQRDIRSQVVSLTSRRILDETREASDDTPATLGEITAALVGDTAVFGPTSPILGSRYRFEVAPAVGGLSTTRLLLDYRRYAMPVKPYTLAARFVHLAQYGRDAGDPRVPPTFLGSRYFVRGYGWGDITCQWDSAGKCGELEALLGNRLVATNVELRAPLVGMFMRDIRYGPVPLEGFLFADGGAVWSHVSVLDRGYAKRTIVTSAGLGVRMNAIGFPVEFAVVRAFDRPARGWSFDFSFRSAF